MPAKLLRTAMCDDLGMDYPILLAGMGAKGRATPPKLAAAVTNAGGLGVIGVEGLPVDEIRSRIRELRALTNGKPFGVDLLLPASMDPHVVSDRPAVRRRLKEEYPQHVAFVQNLLAEYGLTEVLDERVQVISAGEIQAQVQVVLEERPPLLAVGLGDPSWVVPLAHEAGIKLMGLAGSVRQAQRQVEAGVDYIVAQGTEAGGHTGRVGTFALLPQVIDAVAPVPVLAAGGIGDGRGVAAALTFGAAGAWIGTAFLVADECGIYPEHKEEIVRGRAEDFIITRAYTGKTARDYRNPIIEAWEKSNLSPLPMPLQWVLMDDFKMAARAADRPDLVNNPAGQGGGAITKIRPAAEIFNDMVTGAIAALERVGGSIG